MGRTSALGFVLAVFGTTSQAVEVSASALSIDTENAKTSVTMNNMLVDELPLVVGGAMRSPFNLAALTPEAKNLGGDNGFILGGGQAARVGQRGCAPVRRCHPADRCRGCRNQSCP